MLFSKNDILFNTSQDSEWQAWDEKSCEVLLFAVLHYFLVERIAFFIYCNKYDY